MVGYIRHHWMLVCAIIYTAKSHAYLASTSVAPHPFLQFSTSRSEGFDRLKSPEPGSLEASILDRHSCKKFRRFDGSEPDDSVASTSDPNIVSAAIRCLDLARRTPTAFNTQPYKVVLVHSPEQKLALSKYCLGPNSARILDSDCTAIFLADRQVFRTFARFRRFLSETRKPEQRPLSKRALLTMQFYITLFSSGYPLPRFLSSPLSFFVRSIVGMLNVVTSRFYPLPSLGNAETWASKQATMAAMCYMLSCTSVGLATIPMEGFNARGIRGIIRAPGRYAVPLIVSTGLPHNDTKAKTSSHDIDDRYPVNDMLFSNTFGSLLQN